MPNSKSSQNGVIYTETFKMTARNILDFLSSTMENPKDILSKQIQAFEMKVDVFPEGCQISSDLLQLGCDRYRECITKDGYRVLYSYDVESEEITAHAIFGQRQSVQQALFERLISI
ncbi:addiction module toxin RelE [Klebsiella pneumoniae]|uniref:hypothetical protein n=1 Tax=Klebsiella pneumoniae TaxID=573 RepID=UPI0006279D6E|nr:hypothetical protein [Klebsiella pneumoniae]KKJ35981.1 translation repressor RelE [Klebsiella pneumoniae MRSN 3852]KMH71255.1 hypothetical protein SM76_01230 [Klebsiella pneumoniae]UAA07847.1 addiction module toxin RelE [Klebsiella pneumoniae]SYC79358.1 Uncharacterised protein [Klebsiella pneumoniae]HBV3338879.1 addiction module toxin RelE [Klebsiella pneumoniae]